MRSKQFTNITDRNGELIAYGQLIDFTWWDYEYGGESEFHLKAKIRKRKSGDIFEFVENAYGKSCKFTHRLSALNWCESDLEIINS